MPSLWENVKKTQLFSGHVPYQGGGGRNKILFKHKGKIKNDCFCIFYLKKEAVCSCFSTFVSSFFVILVEKVCQIHQKYNPLYEHYTDKNNKK